MRDNTFRLLKDGDDADFDTDAYADADDATACDATAFGDEVCCFFSFGVMRALYMLAKHIPVCSTLCNINMHSRAWFSWGGLGGIRPNNELHNNTYGG